MIKQAERLAPPKVERRKVMKLYRTKEELLNSLSEEERNEVVPMACFSEETGELLGYYKFYID